MSENDQFDQLARIWASPISRQRALRLSLGVVAGAMLSTLGINEAEAAACNQVCKNYTDCTAARCPQCTACKGSDLMLCCPNGYRCAYCRGIPNPGLVCVRPDFMAACNACEGNVCGDKCCSSQASCAKDSFGNNVCCEPPNQTVTVGTHTVCCGAGQTACLNNAAGGMVTCCSGTCCGPNCAGPGYKCCPDSYTVCPDNYTCCGDGRGPAICCQYGCARNGECMSGPAA